VSTSMSPDCSYHIGVCIAYDNATISFNSFFRKNDLPVSPETVHSKNSHDNAGVSNTPWRMPPALLFVQVFCFAILYAIWMLPGTIVLRHVCLGLGALLSLYPLYQSRHLFLQKRAIPIWLIATLFGWVTFHLLFLAQDPIAQIAEYTSIWKRSAVGVIFALGMGISIAQLTKITNTSTQIKRWMSACWILFYMGLLATTLIYFIKILLTLYGPRRGIVAPKIKSVRSSAKLAGGPRSHEQII